MNSNGLSLLVSYHAWQRLDFRFEYRPLSYSFLAIAREDIYVIPADMARKDFFYKEWAKTEQARPKPNADLRRTLAGEFRVSRQVNALPNSYRTPFIWYVLISAYYMLGFLNYFFPAPPDQTKKRKAKISIKRRKEYRCETSNGWATAKAVLVSH